MSVGKSVLLLFLFFFSVANATEIFEDYVSTRAAGMGNAFSSIVDNEESLFYNPAGLDRVKGIHLTALNLQIGSDALTAYTTYTQATGGSWASIIHQFFGTNLWIGTSDIAALTLPDLGIATYDVANINFNLHNPAYPNVTMNVTNDWGFAGGVAVPLIPQNIFTLGVEVKRVTRYGARVPFGPSTLATLSNAQLTALINNVGVGYGMDAGVLMELPAPVKPTLSAVWHNIGQTKFIPVTGTISPPPLDNEAVIGYSMLFDLSVIKILPTIEWKHINLQDEALGKRIHTGIEFQFPALSVRAGLNQGYYTAGFGLDFKYMRFQAATYGVELDSYPGQLEDRRYMIDFIVDLNFDPSTDLKKGNRTFQRR